MAGDSTPKAGGDGWNEDVKSEADISQTPEDASQFLSVSNDEKQKRKTERALRMR